MKALVLGLVAAASGSLLAAAAQQPPCQPAGTPVPGITVKRLPATQFRQLHAAVTPRGEAWADIPWETDLSTARQRAAREQKPLLMWIMDGHPLGCT